MKAMINRFLSWLIGKFRIRDWSYRSVVEEHHMSDGSVRTFVREASWDYVGERAVPLRIPEIEVPLPETEK